MRITAPAFFSVAGAPEILDDNDDDGDDDWVT